MKEIYSNINIIGGGLIGASAALSLSTLGTKITVIEQNKPFSPENHIDNRTIAISEGTKKFLEKIELWNDLKKFSQPIEKIKIIDRALSNNLDFDNIRRNSNLGYIVKNSDFLTILYKKLKSRKNVSILNNSKINNLYSRNNLAVTEIDNALILSNLNIAADGKKSFVREILKTTSFKKNYKRKALVINLNHSLPHNSTAYEFFYNNGPLAILPMQKINNNFTSSIVWTNKSDYLESLLELENNKLKKILSHETQNVVGDVKKIISKQIFPINAHLNTSFYENRTIYIGDAAHSFHPIAGQGWNLGMKDVENLYTLATEYNNLGLDLGGKFFCKRYHENNYYNAYRLYQLTDKIDKLFQFKNPIFKIGRLIGLKQLQKNKKINNIISDFAMGIN